MVSGAHEGGIFSLCVLKDGTLVSGGGKDRRVLLWDHDYRKKSEIEVKWCSCSYKTNESFTDIYNEIQTQIFNDCHLFSNLTFIALMLSYF